VFGHAERNHTGAVFVPLLARDRVAGRSRYTFFVQIGDQGLSASAQFLVPSLVTADVTIPSSQLESCQFAGRPCSDVMLLPDFTEPAGGQADVFGLDIVDFSFVDPFSAGVFQSFGANFDSAGTGLVSVKLVPVMVPEPPTLSLSLIGAGLLGLGLWRRGQAGFGAAKVSGVGPRV